MPNQQSKEIKRLTVPLPREMAKILEHLAGAERRTVSNYLTNIVLDHINAVPEEARERIRLTMQEEADHNDGLIEGEAMSDVAKALAAKW